jgi:protein SCO1/2
MKPYKSMNKLWILVGVLGIAACAKKDNQTSRVNKLPYYQEATFTPTWLEEQPSADFHQIPDFSLLNQEGKTITKNTLTDKISVVDFFFTSCPGICPKMTINMALIQDKFIDDDGVLLLSHSVTPDYDSVSVLKEYAKAKGVNSKRWHLLTGERAIIYDLGRNQYFIEEDLGLAKDPDDFIHTENFVLLDGNQHIRGIYNGLNKTAISQLMADITTLKKE